MASVDSRPLRPALLVVDDDSAVVRFIERALRSDYEVTSCSDAKGAMLAVSQARRPFDVVLCDVNLPGTNGLELVKRLRSTVPSLAHNAVLMTGGGVGLDDAVDDAIARAGGDALRRLDKPFTLDDLRAAVRPRPLSRISNDDAAST
ncbi:response regulator [Labilithrix luteola]|nr:response regulator [Labilithrix luteola]